MPAVVALGVVSDKATERPSSEPLEHQKQVESRRDLFCHPHRSKSSPEERPRLLFTSQALLFP